MRLSLSVFAVVTPVALTAQSLGGWPQHSMDRPQPTVVTPAYSGAPVPAPREALVLFDGTSLRYWRTADSAAGPAKWRVVDGYMEVVPGAGAIVSRWALGDVQLHVEFSSPSPPSRQTGQNRGNSGVFLMRTYEVQVLDSYENRTYPDGQAGSIYGQYPPLVNASRAPGEWQSFDIVFRAPRFRDDSSVASPARMTVFHNGLLVQDNVSLVGPTSNGWRAPYIKHADWLPILLQDHGEPVRYRNIWAVRLNEGAPPAGLGPSVAAYLAQLRTRLAPLQRMLDSAVSAVRADSGTARADSAAQTFRLAFAAAVAKTDAFRDSLFEMTAFPEGATAQRYRRDRFSPLRDPPNADLEAADSTRALLRSFGVWPVLGEGTVYVQVSAPAIRDRFRAFVTPAMREYLTLVAMDQTQPLWSDASLMGTWSDHADRLAAVDRFLARHPQAIGRADIQQRRAILWRLYLLGADNTRAFDGSGVLDAALRRSYERFVATHADSESGRTLVRYLEVLRVNGYRRTPAVQAFQTSVGAGRH